jgi:NADH dehydrogenase
VCVPAAFNRTSYTNTGFLRHAEGNAMTTVSVFGGSGFLGRRLVRRLAAEGATLRIAVRSPDRARSVLGAVDLDRVTVFRADVRDQTSVAAAVTGVDAVVNVVSAYVEKARRDFRVGA